MDGRSYSSDDDSDEGEGEGEGEFHQPLKDVVLL